MTDILLEMTKEVSNLVSLSAINLTKMRGIMLASRVTYLAKITTRATTSKVKVWIFKELTDTTKGMLNLLLEVEEVILSFISLIVLFKR